MLCVELPAASVTRTVTSQVPGVSNVRSTTAEAWLPVVALVGVGMGGGATTGALGDGVVVGAWTTPSTPSRLAHRRSSLTESGFEASKVSAWRRVAFTTP
ncbi:hypothetical protein BL253_18370 [Pseudofrankia asymbiotica]|uniref:Uncharacterized protein n=1 Tax=Pseudofrankia asymbiotica TaxID=1834516 RepID=A0A1V2I8S0_9ACTN|nr:hypothetical protein BL253_18370 [Pseudofrankia asymbiotica]